MELPKHVQETVDALADVRAAAAREVSTHQRIVEQITRAIAQPLSVIIIVGAIVVWTAMNIYLGATGRAPFDAFPFQLLQGIVGACALIMTVLIITSETRIGREGDRLARLALQMALVTEQKVAKIIELLEDDRRETARPTDAVAAEMAQSIDPQAALHALDESAMCSATSYRKRDTLR